MKKVMWSIVGLALAGLGIVSYLWFTPGRTPAIHRPHSIASLERIRIGDVDLIVRPSLRTVSHLYANWSPYHLFGCSAER